MTTFETQPDSPDTPPTGLIATVVVVSFLFVFSFWFVSDVLLVKVSDKIMATEDSGMGNATRLEYVQSETEYLDSYAKLDSNTYKIPIQNAMDEVIRREGQ